MRTRRLRSFFGTRHSGLAPLDLLLLVALTAAVIAAASQRLLPHGPGRGTLCSVSSSDPLIQWDGVPGGVADTYSLTDPQAPLPVGAVVAGFDGQPLPSETFGDGTLFAGDRLLSARSHGTRWVPYGGVSTGGSRMVTGWTFVVRHKGQIRALHLTNPLPPPGCQP